MVSQTSTHPRSRLSKLLSNWEAPLKHHRALGLTCTMVYYGMVWSGLVWSGLVWCGVAWHGIVA